MLFAGYEYLGVNPRFLSPPIQCPIDSVLSPPIQCPIDSVLSPPIQCPIEWFLSPPIQCPIEWFHFQCVGLTSKPKGKWYCPQCTTDKKQRATK